MRARRTCSLAGIATLLFLLVPSCGSPSTALRIEVTDLPSGSHGDVDVSGPGGYSRHLQSSTTLDVGPGTYSVTAHPLRIGSAHRHPTVPTTATALASGDSSSVLVDYAVLVPDTTVTLDASRLTADAGAGITADQISGPADLFPALHPGDVVGAAVGPLTPDGLIRRVVSVTADAGTTTIATASATLRDALPEGAFHVTFDSASHASEQNLRLVARGGRALPIQLASLDQQLQVTWPDQPCTGDLTLTPDYGATLMPHVDLQVAWNSLAPTQVRFLTTLTEQAHVGVVLAGGGTCTKDGATPEILTPPITFLVGGFPVVIIPGFSGHGSLDGTFDAAQSLGLRQVARLTAGILANQGHVSPIQSASNAFTPTVTPTVDATASMSVGPRLLLHFYDPLADDGPYVGLDVGVEVTDTQSGLEKTLTTVAFLRAEAGVKFGFLGFDVDYSIPKLMNLEKVIGTTSVSPPVPSQTSVPAPSIRTFDSLQAAADYEARRAVPCATATEGLILSKVINGDHAGAVQYGAGGCPLGSVGGFGLVAYAYQDESGWHPLNWLGTQNGALPGIDGGILETNVFSPDCLNVRHDPSSTATIVACAKVPAYPVVELPADLIGTVGPPVYRDGHMWWQVRVYRQDEQGNVTPGPVLGWAQHDYLSNCDKVGGREPQLGGC